MTIPDNCNIQQQAEMELMLLNWVNQFYKVSSLNELSNISTLVLFLKKLFNLESIVEQDDLFSQITFQTSITLPLNFNFSAFLNGDQNQILILLGFIQTQYQYYILHDHILKNSQISFTSYVKKKKKIAHAFCIYLSNALYIRFTNLYPPTNWTI